MKPTTLFIRGKTSMTTVIYPSSDENRSTLLNTIVDTAEQEHLAGNEHIPPTLLDELRRVQGTFNHQLQTKTRLKKHRFTTIAQRDQALSKLESFVRAFRSSIQWRVKLYDWTNEYLDCFAMEQTLPHPLVTSKLLTIAGNYERGDTKAITAGYPAMSNPSADELRAKLHDAETLVSQARTSKLETDRAKHEMVPLRKEVDLLLKQASKQLDLSLMRLPADDVRHIKRTYGFVYRE